MVLSVLFSFIFGLVIGSFLNCLIWRSHIKKSILGRSICPECGHQIAWYDNIPLLSFIFLRGRCRFCQKKISLQYPIVELVTGLLFATAFWHHNFNFSAQGGPASGWQFSIFPPRLALLSQGEAGNFQFLVILVRDWLILAILVFIFVYDLKYLEVEDLIILSAGAAVIILNLFLGNYWLDIVWAVLIGVGFFGLQYLLTKGKGIGLGDLSIGFFMGASLGNWRLLLLALFIAYIIGTAISLILLLQKKKGLKSPLPLAPFLAIGTIVSLFWGQQIINWYLTF